MNQPSTRRVDVQHLEAFADAVHAVNRKCEKLGIDALTFREVGPRVQQVRIRQRFDGGALSVWVPAAGADGGEGEGVRTVTTVELSWSGVVRMAGGWRLLGTVERSGVETEGGEALNTINAVPGVTGLEAYRKAELTCDHCGANRRRNKVILLEDASGARRQVGTGCVSDYLGSDLDAYLSGVVAVLAEFMELSDGGGDDDGVWCRGRSESTLALDDVGLLSTAYGMKLGYRSRKRAQEAGEAPTAWIIEDVLSHRARGVMHPEDERIAEAMADGAVASDWALTKAQLDALVARVRAEDQTVTEFEYGVALDHARGYLIARKIGRYVAYCASAPGRRVRDAERAVQKAALEALPPPVHRGVVGEKLRVKVVVKRLNAFDGPYGTRVTVGMVEEGTRNNLVWFASGWGPVEAAGLAVRGEPPCCAVEIVGTVGEHKAGKYGPDTVLKRVVRAPTPGESAAAAAAKAAARKAAREARKVVVTAAAAAASAAASP